MTPTEARFGKLSFAEAIGLIETRFREAVSTLRLIQLSRHDVPDKVCSAWPAVVHDWNAFGGELAKFRQEHAINTPPIPAPEEIDRLDQAMQWLLEVRNGDRAIIMARAEGRSWRWLEDRDGRSARALKEAHERGLEGILGALMAGG